MAEKSDIQQIDFCTLGMFIIDDIYPPPSSQDQTPQKDVIGGAGTYSTIGARLFSPPPTSKTVGWIVDAGPDFPEEIRSILLSWQTNILLRPRGSATTRAWNGYGENEHRAFKYLNEKKRLTAEDLTPGLLGARSFHLICSPTRCVDLVTRISDRRKQLFDTLPRPVFIWEPVPDLCVPAEKENTLQALRHVDVISPNHDELASLFGFRHDVSGIVDKDVVESQCDQLLAHTIGPDSNGAIVVRVGKDGCLVINKHMKRWFPAYHQDPKAVVDPTGGGNGFVGGLAVGLVRNDGDIVEAARWGSVAASFCIEQVGMPVLSTIISTATCTDELWNDESVSDRLKEYRDRTV